MTQSTRTRLALAAIFVPIVLAHLCIWIAQAGRAGAQVVPPQPPPVTDYAAYPGNAGVPDGCDAGDVAGVSFRVNGQTPVIGLQDLGPLNAGDVVSMTWLAVGAECDGAPIVLAMKSAPGPVFDSTVDQALDLPYALDFLEVGLVERSVSYVLPDLLDDSFPGCFGQLDAIVGLPLAVVGPGGSFYSAGLRGSGPNLLISAWNGGYEPCEAPTESTTTTVVEETTTTTTEAPTTTTEATTTTTVAPPSSTTAAPPATIDPPSLTVGVAPAVASRQLAATGSSNGWMVPVAVAAVVAGLAAVVVSRRRLV